jgi:hypothetical protein
METLKFDIATAREKYLESTMVGREYMQKRILSMEDGSYTMAHDLREYDHQVITRTVFNKLPKELVKWYRTDNLENWSRIVDPKKPRIDFEKKEINLLTLRTVKPISEYKKKTKAGAQIVLDFFRDIIANENEGVYRISPLVLLEITALAAARFTSHSCFHRATLAMSPKSPKARAGFPTAFKMEINSAIVWDVQVISTKMASTICSCPRWACPKKGAACISCS